MPESRPSRPHLGRMRSRVGSLGRSVGRALVGSVVGVVLPAGLAACFGEPTLPEAGPSAVYEIISTQAVPAQVSTPSARTVEVIATIEHDCDEYEIGHSLSGTGRELTLQMRVPPVLCRRSGAAFRTYRATIADVGRGALRLRVVHRIPAFPATAVDTVIDASLVVP